jgi:hypothetical protein
LGVITEDEIVVAPDDAQLFATDGLYVFGVRDDIDYRFIVAILNSSLFVYLYRLLALESGRVLAQVKPTILEQLPIRVIDFSNADEVAKHGKMVSLVEQMLELHKKISKIKNPDEKTRIQRQIDAADAQIDKLVYDLYNLTPEEIKIIEESTK